jgi:hypothetical protein
MDIPLLVIEIRKPYKLEDMDRSDGSSSIDICVEQMLRLGCV